MKKMNSNCVNLPQMKSNFSSTIVCRCPNKANFKFSKAHCRKIDLDKTVLKIQELINDPACTFHSRICALLYDFLHENGERGFFVKHLTAIFDILEFLARNTKDVQDYKIHLDRILELCSEPLQLERSSTNISSLNKVIEQYFTTLGCLLLTLSTHEQILKVFRALRRLLFHSKPIGLTVPVEIYHQSMEKSQLPVILIRLLQISPAVIYKRVLDLSFIIVSTSSLCCRTFLQAGALEHLLCRLHSHESGFISQPLNDDIFNLDEDYYDELILATNIMWSLIRVAITIPNTEEFPVFSRDAIRSFRYAFRREIYRSKGNNKSIMMRNDLTCLILAGMFALPFWKLIKSGLADDICILIAIEIKSKYNWANIKLTSSKEDLIFKKMLLLIISYLTESEAAVKIMIDRLVLPAVLQLINLEIHNNYNVSWSAAQFLYLAQHAMSTLTFLAPKMPDEFIKHRASFRLIKILEWSMAIEFQITTVMNIVKTICSIVMINSMIVDDFREQGVIISKVSLDCKPLMVFLELVQQILNTDSLTMQHQRLLTLLIIIMQEVMNNNIHLQEIYGDESVKLILHLLQRCFHQKKGEFLLDQRLLVSTGSFIWQCIVKCSSNVNNFIKRGAIYLLLDIIEGASFSVRCIFLGLLCDMCQVTFCGPHFYTWRGIDKTKGFLSLLAETWREEEMLIGVKRTCNGCIEDLEFPLMGKGQRYTTYHCKQFHDSSPALVDVVGSVRAKIYSIINMMDEEVDKYVKTEKHFKILINDIPKEDLITLCIIEEYYQLKKGQIWIEVSTYLQENGIKPLEMDDEVISVMIQQHRRWTMNIKERQEKILRDYQQKEMVNETEKFSRIRDSTLASTLTALKEINFIRQTTDNNYKNKQAYQRMEFVEMSLNFPSDANEKYCHRMNRNFMNIPRQIHCVRDPEMQYLNLDYENDISPVSPSNSEDQSFINFNSKIDPPN